MARVIISARVAYLDDLLKTFEAQAPVRKQAGERGSVVCCKPNDPNLVYFILDWLSSTSAETFWGSAAAKSQMAKWHAVSSPDILVLDEL